MVKPLFAGERVRLSPLADSDLDVIAQWYADGQWIRMLSAFEVPMTLERLEEWRNRYRNDEKSFLFGVRTKDDDRLVGTVTLEDVLWNHGRDGCGSRSDQNTGVTDTAKKPYV